MIVVKISLITTRKETFEVGVMLLCAKSNILDDGSHDILDISKLSKFPSENELVLRPNTVFTVIEKYTSEQLKNLTGVDCITSLDVSVCAFLNSSHATGIFSNIPANTDVIVLQEIDSDSDQELVSQQPRPRYEAPSIDEVEIPGQIMQ